MDKQIERDEFEPLNETELDHVSGGTGVGGGQGGSDDKGAGAGNGGG